MVATEVRALGGRGRRTRSRALLAALSLLALFVGPAARADRASGTWTGRVETRGSYYWERSTRVVAPTIGGRVESPNGVTVQGYYLVDSITSASVAAGALVDVGFTEVRHEANLTVGGEIDVGEQHLTLTGGLRYSHEPDYASYSGNLVARLALDERTTTIGLSLTVLHDEVRQLFRTGNQVRPGSLSGPAFSEDFDGLVSSLSIEHVMTRRLVLTAGYDFGRLQGFLASPYRQVQVAGSLHPENHPSLRLRHTLWGRMQLAIPEARGALHFLLRGYADDWDVRAITAETRWYQEIGPHLMVRLRHRYYAQTASFFDSGSATMPTYALTQRYFTADPKMQQFHDHEVGAAFVSRLGFLQDSGLRWLARAEIELACDYRFSTNRFGNGVFGAITLRVPID